MPSTISNKTETIVLRFFDMMKRLKNGEELHSKKAYLYGVSERQMSRDLEDIYTLFSDIIVVSTKKILNSQTQRPQKVYFVPRKEDVSDILLFMLEKNDISDFIRLIQESAPEIIHGLDEKMRQRLEASMHEEKDIFLFKSAPFEALTSTEAKANFQKLKLAVKQREHRTLHMAGGFIHEDVKCLKIIYMQENWYLAVENAVETLQFVRVAFITKIAYSKISQSYKIDLLEKYKNFFEEFQNSFTLYDVAPQTALIEASPKIAHYFLENMKPFFGSQTFIAQQNDGSVRFTLDYTQPMEILPFIKRWLPDLTIIEPLSLQEVLIAELNSMLKKYHLKS